MSSASDEESPDERRRKAVIRHAVLWPGLVCLAVASAFCARSMTVAWFASVPALACALILHWQRRGAGHAFIFAQVLLMGGSTILVLALIVISKPVFPVIAAMLEAFTQRFFGNMGEFAFLYGILWVIVMAFMLASQRDR